MSGWAENIFYFFAGALMTNGLPHFISGITGRPFQTPFAKPPGEGCSSSTVNVLWGFLNIAGGASLVSYVGDFSIRAPRQVLSLGLGILLMALMCARLFGRFHGGDTPDTK